MLAVLGTGGSGLVAAIAGVRRPAIQDEFSYLLQADTFAHGRLTNPPHPMAVHFETVHVLQWPTYASKFPPGHGLMLALGQVLTGQPMAGVWLANGLFCGAVVWMLRAWLPPRWAVVGGLLAALQFSIASFWSQTYAVMALPALGGALVYGAVPRLVRRPSAAMGVVMALGWVILANARPCTGFLISLLAAAAVAWAAVRRWAPGWRVRLKVAASILVVLVPAAAAMFWYNHCVTGNALLLPHVLHTRTYYEAPNFLFLPVGEPIHTAHPDMVAHAAKFRSIFLEQQSVTGWLQHAYLKARAHARVYLGARLSVAWYWGIPLATPLLCLPWAWRDHRIRWALAVLAVFAAGRLAIAWDGLHYAAPVTALVLAVVVACYRRLAAWRPMGSPVGRWMVIGLLMLNAAYLLPEVLNDWKRNHYGWGVARSGIADQLRSLGDRHLVFVRYGPEHHPFTEWVANAADMESSNVLWARAMTPWQDAELRSYCADRTPWLLDLSMGDGAPQLLPWPARPACTSPSMAETAYR